MPTFGLRGNSGLGLTGKKVGATGTAPSIAANVKSWSLTPAEGDAGDLTFEEALAGAGVDWTLSLTAAIDLATANSLWNWNWTNAGQDAEFVLAPYGNATGTAAQPVFSFTANVGLPPTLGNEAKPGSDKSRSEFTTEMKVVGNITKSPA